MLLLSIPKTLQREEQEASEWRRRLDECTRQAKEEAERNQAAFEQAEKKLSDSLAIQLQEKEVGEFGVLVEGYPTLQIPNRHAGLQVLGISIHAFAVNLAPLLKDVPTSYGL